MIKGKKNHLAFVVLGEVDSGKTLLISSLNKEYENILKS